MDDEHSPKKRARAIDLYREHRVRNAAVLSVQVLQEYFSAATQKLNVSREIAQRKLEAFARGSVVRLEAEDVVLAIDLHRLNRISFWDALILHAARKASAAILYTEDLQHGAVICGVRIENPFLAR